MLQEGAWIRLDDRKKRFARNDGIQVPRNDLNGYATNAAGSFWFLARETIGSEDDRYSRVGPARAIPVLDLRHLSIFDVRRKVLREGVRLPDHQMRQALVLLPEGKYARLKFEKTGSYWIAKLPADNLVELRAVDPSWDVYQHSDDFGYLPLDAEGSPHGEVVDWTSDREFLAKLVKRYKSAVEGYIGLGSKTVDDPVKRLQRALSEAHLLGEDGRAREAAVRRLREESKVLLQGLESIEDVGQLLLNSDAGRQLLERTVEARTRSIASDMEAQARYRLDESLRAGQDEINVLENRILSLRGQVTTLEEVTQSLGQANEERRRLQNTTDIELSARQAALDVASEKLSSVQEALSAAEARSAEAKARESSAADGLSELKQEMAKVARDLLDAGESANLIGDERIGVLGRRIKALLGTEGEDSSDQTPLPSPPWTWSRSVEPSTISLAELPIRLEEEANFHGVNSSDLQLLDAASRAGELVFLVGPSAELALTALTRAVAGGHVRNHVLDPSAIGLDDLWRVPGSHRPTAFATAWSRALQEPETSVLVCLRNIDAAPFRLWLRSLRAALASPMRPSNLIVLATTIGRTGDEDDFPDATELRHDLIAISVRLAPDGYQCEYALGYEPNAASVLRADPRSRRVRITAPPASLRRSAHAPETVLRTLRLRGLLSEPLASGVVLSWANYLTSGQFDDLQEPLRDAHVALKSLRLQH